VVAEVIARAAGLPLREVFCEVLNPEGGNLERMQAALAGYPKYAAALRDYRGKRWAEFTFDVLDFGFRTTRRFVPCPLVL
jgi:hypothetical protein